MANLFILKTEKKRRTKKLRNCTKLTNLGGSEVVNSTQAFQILSLCFPLLFYNIKAESVVRAIERKFFGED